MNSSGRQKSQLFHSTTDSNGKVVSKWKTKFWKPRLWKLIRSNLLVIATFTAVILGIIVGGILRTTVDKWTERDAMYVNFVGELFLRILKSLILPLIVTSLITGIASLDISLSRKIGVRAVAFYLTTTFFAVVLGIIMVSLIQPGKGGTHGVGTGTTRNVNTVDTLLDLVRNIFPPNIVQACLEQSSTNLKLKEGAQPNSTNMDDFEIKVIFTSGTNIIGLVALSTVIGIAMSILNTKLAHFIALTNELYELSMKLTAWAMCLSPIGIFFLIVAEIVKIKNLGELGQSLGLYVATVLIGLFIQAVLILPLIYFCLTRFQKNPFRFIRGLSQALVTAFGTGSSSATMPVTLKCIIENNNVDENVAKFMLPIGSAINMDGTALYEAVAAIFIAQLRGIDLSFGKLVAISITATAASIGAAGIPSAGLVTMIMVLDTVGIPAEDVSLILAVDWFLDRVRTVVNVMGDAFGAGIIYEWSKDDIGKMKERIDNGERNNSSARITSRRNLTMGQARNQSSISFEQNSTEDN